MSLLICCFFLLTPGPALGSQEISVDTSSNLDSLIATASEGAVFRFTPGIHRGISVTPKAGQRFVGALGADGERQTILRGSRVLDGFKKTAEGLWALGVDIDLPDPHGQCDEDPLCGMPLQVFVDGSLLRQMNALRAGDRQWMFDSARKRVFLGFDPGGKTVELSYLPFAFRGPADAVVVENLVIERYATRAQHGAIDTQRSNRRSDPRGSGWKVLNNEIAWNHGVGVRVSDNALVVGNEIHNNGQLGVKGSGNGILVDRNEIYHNHHGGFRRAWEAGGIKLTRTGGARVTDNRISDNDGTGIWLDIDTADSLVRGNDVSDNSRVGIHVEISTRAVVEDNRVSANGFGRPDWGWGAGILVANSSSVRVARNVLDGNADGIIAIDQVREDGAREMRHVFALEVVENCVVQREGFAVGILEDHGNEQVFCCLDNVFERNRYQVDGKARFVWQGARMDRSGWLEKHVKDLPSACESPVR